MHAAIVMKAVFVLKLHTVEVFALNYLRPYYKTEVAVDGLTSGLLQGFQSNYSFAYIPAVYIFNCRDTIQ